MCLKNGFLFVKFIYYKLIKYIYRIVLYLNSKIYYFIYIIDKNILNLVM